MRNTTEPNKQPVRIITTRGTDNTAYTYKHGTPHQLTTVDKHYFSYLLVPKCTLYVFPIISDLDILQSV